MSWTCPECEADNADELCQCFCGYLNSDNIAPHEESLKRCPSCHEQMPAEDTYCSFCGKAAVVLTEKENPEGLQMDPGHINHVRYLRHDHGLYAEIDRRKSEQ